MDIKLNFASIRELSCKIETGELSPISLVEDSFNQIKEYNPTFNAFITILEKAALREAETTEKRVKKGHYKGPLDGIPYSLKDIIYVKGVRCTAGSRILKHFFPKRNAECVSQLRRAGSIIVGTTNMNEFASGITGINPHYGSSINPWNKDHLSGGSSGGSCVSVSCGMVPFSLGTDTGGSIRVPSAYCGVVGIKPTYNLISRDGIINLAPSLDNIGCITRSAWDAALVLKNLIQKDRLFHYPKISNSGEDIFEEIGHKHRKLVVGIPHDYFFYDADLEIVRSFYEFVNVIESFGNQIKMVSVKGVNKIESAWTSIRLAEASEQHLRWIKSRASEYSEEVRTMIRNGLRIFAVDYIHSCGFKNEIRNYFLKSLKIADILILPTTTVTAPKYSSFVRDNEESSKIRSALLRNNIPFNIAGLPAVSIPVGFDRFKIPIGVQIVGKPYQEGTILSIAFAFEQKYNSLAKFIPPI